MKQIIYEVKFEDIGEHGQIELPFKHQDFIDAGIEYEDTVKVTFLDKTIIVPFAPSYRCTYSGGSLLVDFEGKTNIALLAFHANFVTIHKIAVFLENDDRTIDILPSKFVKFPIKFTFELDKKKGYHDTFLIYDLKRTNNRDDYKELSDEDFCNFREVSCGRIKNGILYRTSSPIDPALGRNKYADDCLKKYGIKTIINLCDNEDEAKSYPGYSDTYYSKQKILFLNCNADVSSYNFGKSVLKTMRFINENDGPYVIHCLEGQDRTGAMLAIFESLLSASRQELIIDFMKTYENYYKVERDSFQYETIAKGELQTEIANIRGFSYGTLDILKNPESYLLFLDLLEEDLAKFKRKMQGLES